MEFLLGILLATALETRLLCLPLDERGSVVWISALFYLWQLARGFLKNKEQTCQTQIGPFQTVLG